MINNCIGFIIKFHREILKMEQAELAEKVGVSQPVISRLEKGEANWTVSRLCHVCDALNLDVKHVITQALLFKNK